MSNRLKTAYNIEVVPKLQKAFNTESNSERVNPIDFYRCFAKKIKDSEYKWLDFIKMMQVNF